MSGLFIADFFQSTYGFSPGVGGLAYLGLGVGFLLSTFSSVKFADGIYKYVSLDLPHFISLIVDFFRRLKLSKKNGGVSTPEMRIPVLFFGSFFVPVGIL